MSAQSLNFCLTKHQLSKSNKGQAFLDIIIATSIFLILTHAIFTIIIAIYDTLLFSKNQLSAKYIATQQMEYLLNLPYDQLGTTSGIPPGIIPEFETIERNGQFYEIHTSIIYYDDPFDELAPSDLLPTDYKKIRVSVQIKNDQARYQPVVLVTNIAPKGVETLVGGGTLSILVINAYAQPVPQAQVHITNSNVIPNIDITLQTNFDGRVILPGAPTCSTCYQIEVSKNNFTTDKTYTTQDLANPNKRPITIEAGSLSETVFVIDQISKITITSTQNQSNFPIAPNATFRLTGSKTIGTNDDGDPVYKFDQVFTTNNQGIYVIETIEWDNYLLTIPPDQNQDLASINPSNPISVYPNQELQILYAIHTNSDHSLLMTINDASGSAIASASAILILEPDFIASRSSGLVSQPNFGQVFFDNLLNQLYQYTISHPQYATVSGSIHVEADKTDTIILNQN